MSAEYELSPGVCNAGWSRLNPFGDGVEVEAMLGSGVLATTRSHHIARLMEIGDVDLDEALTLTGFRRDDLDDPSIFLDKPSELPRFYSAWTRYTHARLKEKFEPEVERLQQVVDSIMEDYVIADPEAASSQARTTQDEINRADKEYQGPEFSNDVNWDDPEEVAAYRRHKREVALLVMEREALDSGVLVSADEFVARMISAPNVLFGPDRSPITITWIDAIKYTIDHLARETAIDESENWLVSDLIANRETFEIMRSYLTDSSWARMNIIEKLWEETVKQAFQVPTTTVEEALRDGYRSEETLAWRAQQATRN